jgi:hypothetical protein
LFATRSANSSTAPSANLKRFCTTLVSSRMRRAFSPASLRVSAARMMISVFMGALRISTPA